MGWAMRTMTMALSLCSILLAPAGAAAQEPLNVPEASEPVPRPATALFGTGLVAAGAASVGLAIYGIGWDSSGGHEAGAAYGFGLGAGLAIFGLGAFLIADGIFGLESLDMDEPALVWVGAISGFLAAVTGAIATGLFADGSNDDAAVGFTLASVGLFLGSSTFLFGLADAAPAENAASL